MSRLDAYLARIGYVGPVRVDRETLFALHRAHLLAIPYENLDIHLDRPLILNVDHVYDKIVVRGRGGWCYEMNGLFAWALREIGFDVTLLSSDVGRKRPAPHADDRDHLVLRVELDEPYLADVGFGNGFAEPVPLREGAWRQGRRTFTLSRDGDQWWLSDTGRDGAGYDFTLRPRQYADFADRCAYLQTAPSSGFVRAARCYRFVGDDVIALIGLVRTDGLDVGSQRVIADRDEYASTLRDTFGLRLTGAEVGTLWTRAERLHASWLAEQAAAAG